MATLANVAVFLALQLLIQGRITRATWCVARSGAAEEALQEALDYACGAGADCTPIQEGGPCFVPDTLQSHASYAFNSYYMCTSMAAASCDFAGSATIAKTDPSYGSCVYPASPSTTEGTTTSPPPGDTTTIPTPSQNTTAMDGNQGALTPIDAVASPPSSQAFVGVSISRVLSMSMIFMVFLFVA